MNEKEIIRWIQQDEWMMSVLHSARTLNLPDWWICAGFVRSKIWDTLHHFNERTPLADVDVVYYQPEKIEEKAEKASEEKLWTLMPDVPWSVKNEARMHVKSNMPPYSSSVDAISKFPETATALGVKVDVEGRVILTAPCGIADVVNLEVKPTSFFAKDEQRLEIYQNRVAQKDWLSIWPKLKVVR